MKTKFEKLKRLVIETEEALQENLKLLLLLLPAVGQLNFCGQKDKQFLQQKLCLKVNHFGSSRFSATVVFICFSGLFSRTNM